MTARTARSSLRRSASQASRRIREKLALFNVEYVLGVHNDVSVGLFADSGMVWGRAGDFDLGDLKSSLGIGLILAEPGDNSLRLDLIQPLESGGRFLVQGRLTRPF